MGVRMSPSRMHKRTLVGQGYAVNDEDWQEGEDCFTKKARDEFGLVQDQKDCALL